MKTVEFRFHDTTFEGVSLRHDHDLLLGVIATFEIVVDRRLLYREVMFPVVELRDQLARWLDGRMDQRDDFVLASMESDLELVWLRWSGTGWRVGSIHQEYPETWGFDDEIIRTTLMQFIREVDAWVTRELHVDIERFLQR